MSDVLMWNKKQTRCHLVLYLFLIVMHMETFVSCVGDLVTLVG